MPFYNRVWPKDDPFWTYNQPGTLWNCKCDWEQTDEEPTDGNPDRRIVKPGLDQNPATSGQIFTDTAAYIKKAPKNDAFYMDLNSRGASEMRHQTIPEVKVQTSIGEVKVAVGRCRGESDLLRKRISLKFAMGVPSLFWLYVEMVNAIYAVYGKVRAL